MLKRGFLSLILLGGGFLTAASVFGEEKSSNTNLDFQTLKNFQELATAGGFQGFYNAPLVQLNRKIKVAVFDNSFQGFEKQTGKTLPTSVQYFPGIDDGQEPGFPHGLKMAEILWAFATNRGLRTDYEPEMLFFRVNGYTNFELAINTAIEKKVDIIVHSLVRDYGNNFDGKGVFNILVNRATSAGILWINSAGHFAQSTQNLSGPFKTNAYNQIVWPNGKAELPVKCTPVDGSKTCRIRLALSWNSYSDNLETGTDKDLDMSIGLASQVIQSSELRQTKNKELQEGQTKFPREIITADLKVGSKDEETFYVTITNVSKNFGAKDQLRLVADGLGVTFDPSDSAESLLNPADNPNVITVGEVDTRLSSLSVRLGKPEITAPSTLIFGDLVKFQGSSNSAAIVGAAATLLLERDRTLTTKTAMLGALTSGQYVPGKMAVNASAPQNGSFNGAQNQGAAPASNGPTRPGFVISAAQLGFGPANGARCFSAARMNPPPLLQKALDASRGVLVETTQGVKIMMPMDPLARQPQLQRRLPNDLVAISPSGLQVLPRGSILTMPSNWMEVFGQTPDLPPCEVPQVWQTAAAQKPANGQGQSQFQAQYQRPPPQYGSPGQYGQSPQFQPAQYNPGAMPGNFQGQPQQFQGQPQDQSQFQDQGQGQSQQQQQPSSQSQQSLQGGYTPPQEPQQSEQQKAENPHSKYVARPRPAPGQPASTSNTLQISVPK